MPTGNRRRRTARRFALSMTLLIATTAGCGRPAVRHIESGSIPPGDPAQVGPPAEPDAPPAPIPAPVGRPADVAETPAPTPTPTPTLDAGLVRAEALRQSIVAEVAGAELEPAPPPSSQAARRDGAGPLARPETMTLLGAGVTPLEGPPATTREDQEPAPGGGPPADPDPPSTGPADGPQPPAAGGKPGSDPVGDGKPEPRARDVAANAPTKSETAAPDRARTERTPDAAGPGQDGGPWHALVAGMIGPKAPQGEPSASPGPSKPAEAEEPFAIAALTPCRRVLGFGSVEPWGAPDARPGQSLILYCEMAGLRYEPEGDRFRSRLAATLELIPEGTDRPAWAESLGAAEDECRRPRRDYYVSYRIALPAGLAPGPYRLRLTQADQLAGRSTSRTIPLTIGR